MELDPNLYLHESDKAALTVLRAIPGFGQVMRLLMSAWNEQQFTVINMSTNLRLGEGQLDKYYDMLPPICDKLGIEVPDLYLSLDVKPNAYTYGDTNPFIVLTSGLLETMPDELIPTVLAHECGHIACHHTLYHSLGKLLFNGTAVFAGKLANIALSPIQMAFAYWMRCSEYSADRAAVICDDGSHKVEEMCMRFAGYTKKIDGDANVERFLMQAQNYKFFVDNSAWSKYMEFMFLQNKEHPLAAVRAYEAREWAMGERFGCIMDYVNSSADGSKTKIPIKIAPQKYLGKNYVDIQYLLMGMGFTGISVTRTTESPERVKSGSVLSVSVNGYVNPAEEYYSRDSKIEITYYDEKTDEEIAAEHPGEILVEEDYKFFLGMAKKEAVNHMKNLGFTNVVTKKTNLSKLNMWDKEKTVARISIADDDRFTKKSWFMPDAKVVIYCYTVME